MRTGPRQATRAGYAPQVHPRSRLIVRTAGRHGDAHTSVENVWAIGGGVGSELSAEVDQPVHPRNPATGKGSGTEGDQNASSGLAGAGVVAVGGGDGPDDRGDDQHQHRSDQDERQQGADDGAKITKPAETAEVGEHVHGNIAFLHQMQLPRFAGRVG